MAQQFHVKCIEGTVNRILGAHQTTDVQITERTTTVGQPSASTAKPFFRDEPARTETHTFVNTSREFAMLIEVEGYTLKLISGDYIAVALGDKVRAICEVVTDAPLLVLDWSNVTRQIRFRNVPAPLTEAAPALLLSTLFILLAFVCLHTSARYHLDYLQWCAFAAVASGVILAIYGFHTADRITRVHAEIDGLDTMTPAGVAH